MRSNGVVHRDQWGHEREGYSQHAPQVAYAPAKSVAGPSAPGWLRWEERFASLGAGLGLIWGVNVSATNPQVLEALRETPGPLEFCSICALIWLHAKWRRSIQLR